MKKMVQTDDLIFEYAKRDEEGNVIGSYRAIDQVNLEVEEGQFIAVLGHNGSGKSTLAKHLNAILVPTEGTVWVDGTNTSDPNELWNVRQSAGMVFQNPDNQIIGTVVEEDVGFGPENLGVPTDEITLEVKKADGEKKTITYEPTVTTRYMMGFNYDDCDRGMEFTYVQQDMPLAAAGVVAGDLLVSINGAPITCVADFTAYQTEHPFDGSAVTLEYEHSQKTKEITVTPVENTYANVQFSYQLREKQSPIGVLKYSVLEIKYWVRTVIDSVGMLITGQYSVNDLSGPVGVVDAIGTAYDDVKSQGVLVTVMTMLNMVILLSSNLGVMNLLPLPALDGGRLVFLIIEAIRRKPIRRDLEGMVHFAGLVLLMALMVYVMIHDVQRIL